MTTIEKDIKNIIDEITGGKYVGRLKVIKDEVDDSVIWMLLLYLDLDTTPMVLAYEGTEEKFKEFIYTELKKRKLHTVKFWKAVQELPHLEGDCDE